MWKMLLGGMLGRAAGGSGAKGALGTLAATGAMRYLGPWGMAAATGLTGYRYLKRRRERKLTRGR